MGTMPPQKQNRARKTGHAPHGSHAKGDGEKTMGVQKIKSALRQSRRLLRKDNLAADVRIATERRIKSLEHDLEVAEMKRKEQSLATRYHKIKFFERQKVARKITQVKKQLSEGSAKTKLEELNNTLFELRVDFNYILHFPKVQKYISLFPSPSQSDDQPSTSATENDTDVKRDKLRSTIRTQMKDDQLPPEPELLERGDRYKEHKKTRDLGSSSTNTKLQGEKEVKVQMRQKTGRKQAEVQESMEVDDFFENEDDDDDDDGDESEGE